jgi:hypothetical protein
MLRRLVYLIAGLSLTAAAEETILPPDEVYLADRNAILSLQQQEEWLEQLTMNSASTPITVFSALGHLEGLSGDFEIQEANSSAAAEWLLYHATLFGIPDGAELELHSELPFYEFDSEDMPYQTADQYGFRVVVDGLPSPNLIWVIVRSTGPFIRGVYNSFDPVLHERVTGVQNCTEGDAWGQAESEIQDSLAQISAELVWLDESWARERIPGDKVRHWVLEGEDSSGLFRRFAVSCDTGTVTLDESTSWDFSGGLAINGYTPDYPFSGTYHNSTSGNGCTQTSASPNSYCTDPAYAMTLELKNSFESTVDTWGVLTTAPTWSLGQFMPGDLKVIAADAYEDPTYPWCANQVPCFSQTIFAFPSFSASDVSQASTDIVGHEYGHLLLRRYKMMETNQAPPFTVRGQFTEGMCDFVGISTEDFIAQNTNQTYRTNWKLNPTHPDTRLRFDWLNGGAVSGQTCRSDPRRVLTYLFGQAAAQSGLTSWVYTTAYQAGIRDLKFEAWRTDILHSFSLLPNMTFPNGRDLLAATTARVDACLQDPNCDWQGGQLPKVYSYYLYSKLNMGFWNTSCAL